MEENDGIESILVVPRSKNFARFFLNGSEEPHSMKYDELRSYLVQLDPMVAESVYEYISESRIFMLFPKDHKIFILKSEEMTPEQLHAKLMGDLNKTPRKTKPKQTLQNKTEKLIQRLYAKNDRNS